MSELWNGTDAWTLAVIFGLAALVSPEVRGMIRKVSGLVELVEQK